MVFESLFNMWLEGVKIIISFIPIGIGMILLPALLIFALDLFAGCMFSDFNNGNIELIIIKALLSEDAYNKVWNFLNKKGE